jgi:aspartyl-tRNA(Asn)/glutamyl-tRNA(Gln) amidotransferase subunit B
MPGVLPVVNAAAVTYAVQVALALECEIATTSLFARKNYFYPDLPKGYQISQYEQPLARNGRLRINTARGEQMIRIRRVHLEEDTGKLTHIDRDGETYSLVDINRAGVPLLEIVSEPDLHSAEEVRAYAAGLRAVMQYLGVNSGDMEKGLLRVEPNVSVRLQGDDRLGTRVEIKNLNSFRALERAVDYEIERQAEVLQQGGTVVQETVGWDEKLGITISQRTKEAEDDYRYFPEPDLPPLVVDPEWVAQLRADLPELPAAKLDRFQSRYHLSYYDAEVLIAEREVADYFEAVLSAAPEIPPKNAANWITGELFGLLNQASLAVSEARVTAAGLAGLLRLVANGEVNNTTGKAVLAEMFKTGREAAAIIEAQGLRQISAADVIADLVGHVLDDNPEQVALYLEGKTTVERWLFGQVMRAAAGRANPQIVQTELSRQLEGLQAGRG